MSNVFDLWAVASLAASLLLLLPTIFIRLWRYRKIGGEIITGMAVATLPLILFFEWPLPAKLFAAIVQLWLIILALRWVIGRLEPEFLRISTQYNAALALAFVGLTVASVHASVLLSVVHYDWVLLPLLGVAIGLAAWALGQALWTLRHYQLRLQGAQVKNLPTVSVCIPARNETNSLTECLMAVLASDYPKLEVLVLDDCSQDKTSHIIRSFAHDGVRFVQGDTPAEGWLGKNQAMHTLAEHASGELILFMDVDTHVAPHSISRLVQYALRNNLNMVSVLPQQRNGLGASTLCAPMQYYWRMVFPITKRHMPVSSKAWLIRASALRGLGGFESVRHKIIPEGSFARRLHITDAYRFIVSNGELSITTDKTWNSQVHTAFRIAYPTLKRQPINVLGVLLAMKLMMLMPFIIVGFLTFFGVFNEYFWLALLASMLWLASFGLILWRTTPGVWPLSAMLLPYIVVQEAVIFIASMMQYEFGEVDWKGRNVCYPVIAVPPRGFRPSERHPS